MVEKIFRKSVEFCNESEVWKLNVAHVLFMQETKYKEAISFYEPIVKKQYENVRLDTSYSLLDSRCNRDRSSKSMRFVHHDVAERRGGGTHATD
jgi:hypothetical protein